MDLKVTINNNDGESTISGKAHPLPTPKIFPPPYYIRFTDHKTTGKLWQHGDFEVKSGKIEHQGEEFDIKESKGSWDKGDDNSINLRIMQYHAPDKIFSFPY
ncbi:hypothetical protein ACTFIV_007334 [Dictyostelium citrinum]